MLNKKYIIIAVLVVILFVAAAISFVEKSGDNYFKEIVMDADLTIDTTKITDKVSFYPVEIEKTQLEVLAVKASDGTIRTAFNTCQVCYSSGRGYYKQEGDSLICQNCGNRFGMDDIEVTRGGCNPVPITFDYKTVKDTTITISKDFLTKAKDIFANWKV